MWSGPSSTDGRESSRTGTRPRESFVPRRSAPQRKAAGRRPPLPFSLAEPGRLRVEVQREFVRMRAQAHRADFFGHLVVNPGFDQVLGEYVALEQVLVIVLQVVQRFIERCWHARYLGQLRRSQGVDILVE